MKSLVIAMTLVSGFSLSVTQTLKGYDQLSKGFLENALLTASGELQVGYPLKTITLDIPGVITALTPGETGVIYAATSGPGQIWQIKPSQKPKLLLEIKQPLISKLLWTQNQELAILAGPGAGVIFLKPDRPNERRVVKIKEQPFDAYWQDQSLYVVGQSNQLFTIKNDQVTQTPIVATEGQFRSIYKNYYGSAQTGTLYCRNKAIFTASGEVVALVGDTHENLYAAFNTSSNSSQIWKISPKETSCLVWESSKQIIFSMILNQEALYWGSGPGGQLYRAKPECQSKPDLLLSLQNHARIAQIAPSGSKLLIAANKSNGIFELDLSKKVNSGRYIGPVFKLPNPSQIISSSSGLKLGNTAIPDNSWSDYESDKNRQAQFAQPSAVITEKKPLKEISFGH